jgi:hypothetical protein
VQQRGAITPTVQVKPIPHPVPTQPLETVVEDMETEDEILERQVELTKPAQAKFLVKKIIKQKQEETKTAAMKTIEQSSKQEEQAKAVDKWETVTHKKIPPQEARDRSNWLYIYNQVNQRTHTKRFVGNVEEWKELLSKQLTDDFALLTGCIRVTAPKFDQRMVIECASKSARRLLYADYYMQL